MRFAGNEIMSFFRACVLKFINFLYFGVLVGFLKIFKGFFAFSDLLFEVFSKRVLRAINLLQLSIDLANLFGLSCFESFNKFGFLFAPCDFEFVDNIKLSLIKVNLNLHFRFIFLRVQLFEQRIFCIHQTILLFLSYKIILRLILYLNKRILFILLHSRLNLQFLYSFQPI